MCVLTCRMELVRPTSSSEAEEEGDSGKFIEHYASCGVCLMDSYETQDRQDALPRSDSRPQLQWICRLRVRGLTFVVLEMCASSLMLVTAAPSLAPGGAPGLLLPSGLIAFIADQVLLNSCDHCKKGPPCGARSVANGTARGNARRLIGRCTRGSARWLLHNAVILRSWTCNPALQELASGVGWPLSSADTATCFRRSESISGPCLSPRCWLPI